MELDALARVVLKYIEERDGQTILLKNMQKDTAITQATIRRKIKLLIEKGLILRDGKTFTIRKETETFEQKN